MNRKIRPIKIYDNAAACKKLIYKENKDKSGIYCWNNLITGDIYVGSTVNLTNRFRSYFSERFLSRELQRNRSMISNSLLEYGHSNFSLDILEYCEPNELLVREQYYLDILRPKYNILKIAGSWLGMKHSSETLLKLKNRKLSPEALANLRKAKANSPEWSTIRKRNHSLAVGHTTIVINTKDNSVKIYDSVRKVARSFNVSHPTIINYIKNKKLLKGIFFLTKKKKNL
jgi:group I intron endonuclease